MKIGIDASRAFFRSRTGIEEYSWQVIKYLRNELKDEKVVLYLRPNSLLPKDCDFEIPKKWKVKIIKFPRFWTQVGLSLEMILHPVDTLFIPAHIVPIIHPKNTVVVVHGLEYEFLPKAYSYWEKLYMQWSIRKSCQWASKIIAVSKNTKKDLIKLYKIPAKKIEVIYEGVAEEAKIVKTIKKIKNNKSQLAEDLQTIVDNSKYLLFIGRIEERKNILGIVEAFERLKNKHNLPHKLILVGGLGFGYNKIVKQIEKSKHNDDIYLTGYTDEDVKNEILKKANIFLFPTFYEGFGLPILEAQSVGVPVIASNNSAILEVIGEQMSELLVNSNKPEEIAEVMYKLIAKKKWRENIIQAGRENVKKFSWKKCAQEIKEVLFDM